MYLNELPEYILTDFSLPTKGFYLFILITCKTGHNLNAFNDLLRGGFGVYDYEEPFNLVWINFERSKQLMGEEHIGWLVEIISKHAHIQFSTID